MTSGHRERRLPPPGGRLEFDAIDPFHPPVPSPAGRDRQPASHPRGRTQLRHRIGITLVETGLRLLATRPAVPGE